MDEHGQILFMHARLGMNKASDALRHGDPSFMWVIMRHWLSKSFKKPFIFAMDTHGLTWTKPFVWVIG